MNDSDLDPVICQGEMMMMIVGLSRIHLDTLVLSKEILFLKL